MLCVQKTHTDTTNPPPSPALLPNSITHTHNLHYCIQCIYVSKCKMRIITKPIRTHLTRMFKSTFNTSNHFCNLHSSLTLSDPGCFRQLPIRVWGVGGSFKAPKAPPPYNLESYCVNLHHTSYMCILSGILGMFQLEFFKNFAILSILQRFQKRK